MDKPVYVFKYGGNAMTDDHLKRAVLENLCKLKERGVHVVIVHGGGPFIKKALRLAKIESDFIDGHRKTSTEALRHIEMALKGEVNSNLVGIANQLGQRAVGLSGKDGKTVTAIKRIHKKTVNGKEEEHDLGQVGDVKSVNTDLLQLLLDADYIPIMTCLAASEDGEGFNINADMFAGHIAGALQAAQYVVMTDVDGLRKDIDDPSSLMSEVSIAEIDGLIGEEVIQGGMLPKMESCSVALHNGAQSARIINGTKPGQIQSVLNKEPIGTLITK